MQKNSLFIIDQGESFSQDQKNSKLELLGGKKQEQEVILSDSEDEDQSIDEQSNENQEENNIQKIAEELVNQQPQKDNVQVQYGDKNTEVDTKIVFKDGKMTRVTKKRTTQKLSLIKNVAEVEDVIVKKLPQNDIKQIKKQKLQQQEHILSDEQESNEESDFEEVEDYKLENNEQPKEEQPQQEQYIEEQKQYKKEKEIEIEKEKQGLKLNKTQQKEQQQFQFKDSSSDNESDNETEEESDDVSIDQEKQLKYKRISKRIPKHNEYQIVSEDDEFDNTESEQESQELKIEIRSNNKLRINRNQKNDSMVFEDESMEQSMLSEESHVEEFENLKQNYNRKQSLLQQNEYQDYSKIGFYCSLGTCCFVFCISSILWIILLRLLVIKNQKIREIVYDIPTLGQYHDVYADFFNQYDNNRDKLFETQEILQFKSNPEFGQFQNSVGSFVSSQDQLNTDLYESKVLLSSLQNENGDNQTRRILSKNNRQKNLSKDQIDEQKIDLIIKKLEESQENLKNMENQMTRIKHINNDKFSQVYDFAIQNLSKLYEDSFNLIDLYGKFYVMTNRIWVTTQNIYNLFDKRVVRIEKEMSKEHFKQYSSLGEHIHLPELNYKIADQVPKIEAINLNIDEPSLVQCKLEYEINNDNLTLINNSFDLYIVLDGQLTKQEEEKNSFNLKVKSKKDTDSFQNFFQLNQGNHNISVWAKVYKENLKFKYIDLKCLVFLEYPDIEEYNKID